MNIITMQDTATRVGFSSIEDVREHDNYSDTFRGVFWSVERGTREEQLLWFGSESGRLECLLCQAWARQEVEESIADLQQHLVRLVAMRDVLDSAGRAKWRTTAIEWVERVLTGHTDWDL